MTFSGSLSPTLTELNSRNAIVEATFSIFLTTARKGRVGLLNYFTVLVGHNVLGHDDVRAERLPNRVDVDIAIEAIAGLDRLEELQLLVDLHDLGVLDADVGVGKERRLRLVAEHRDERQRCQDRVVPEPRRGLLVEE